MPRTKKSLADQILALSNPQPASFHPDEEFLADETAAKLCDFTYEEEAESSPSLNVVKRRKRKGLELVEEDPRYMGKVVSRKELEFQGHSPSPVEGEKGWSEIMGGAWLDPGRFRNVLIEASSVDHFWICNRSLL